MDSRKVPFTEVAASIELAALRHDYQALLDALVIASAALKNSGKADIAAIIDKAIYRAIDRKLSREKAWGKLLPDGCSDRRGDSTTQTIRFTESDCTSGRLASCK